MFGNILIMAFRAIRRNVMRSVLTILGIVIGVSAVVALFTIGQGATAQVQTEIGAMGENLLMVHPGAGRRPGTPSAAAPRFELDDADAILREVSGIEHVAPVSSASALAVSGNANWATSVTGTTASYLPCRGYKIDRGRTFETGEETSGKGVCLIGTTTASKLFDADEPLGERIRVGKASCVIIGILASKGQSAMGQDQDDVIIVPIRFLMRRLAGNQNVASISVTVEEGRSTSAVRAQIQTLMRERRRIPSGAEDNFRVDDLQEIATAISQTTSVMTGLLTAIAAVSLLVGGIGIMNIMLVSVTERTREIGIRLAIGAFRSDVLRQFLVESAVLSGFGGLIGLVLGIGGAWLATRSLGMPFVPSLPIAFVAFMFSLLVGVIFGFLPARRASRFNPIEALRHE